METTFNVITYDINGKEFISYDVIAPLVDWYEALKKSKKPKTFEEFKEFVRKESMYHWWARCEWEIVISDWPTQKVERKIDVYDQVMRNHDVVTRLLMDAVHAS